MLAAQCCSGQQPLDKKTPTHDVPLFRRSVRRTNMTDMLGTEHAPVR